MKNGRIWNNEFETGQSQDHEGISLAGGQEAVPDMSVR
jgi:hypothetical protein